MTRKTQKKLRKLLTLVSCAVLLVCVTIAGTVAYLKDTTETVQNTFTVGNVTITLDEKDTDDSTANADRDTANAYKLIPGHDLEKDPTIHVAANSEECYVRAFVTVNKLSQLAEIFGTTEDNEATAVKAAEYITGYDTSKWTANGFEIDATANTIKYEFRYTETVQTSTSVQDLVLFTGVTVPESLTNDQIATLDGLKIDVIAEAIQADGFASHDAAWTGFANDSTAA